MSKLIQHLEKPIITRSYFAQKEEVAVATKKSTAQQTIH
ncbi:hypothetical protein GARC_2976 [Paraglaciecola arctica BSs20135]|uniref:Uncharacterized protein n=2 Tax=Paraglaciecola TaxID=1621534 RepID=K6XH17_9ALTE|nr:hypothetical protein GARC_2976 [Paraglaciecola arctica BSs20135]